MKGNLKIVLAGFIAVSIQSIYYYFSGPILAVPPLQKSLLFSNIFHLPIQLGWLVNLFVGILFAYIYSRFVQLGLIKHRILSGIVFGLILFFFFQIFFSFHVASFPPAPENLSTADFRSRFELNSLIGHLIFGTILGLFFKIDNTD